MIITLNITRVISVNIIKHDKLRQYEWKLLIVETKLI